MKCQQCGHDYPGTITRCTRCGHMTPKKGQRPSQSRLIEFPRKTRTAVENPAQEAALPAWRVELNEKVRQARARRQGDSSASDLDFEQIPSQPPAEIREKTPLAQTAESNPGNRRFSPRDSSSFTSSGNRSIPMGAAAEAASELDSGGRGASRDSSEIVEAALIRARRASETASRAALPRIEPARGMQPGTKSSLSIDKQATARALEPTVELEPRTAPPPAPRIKDEPAPRAARVAPPTPAPAPVAKVTEPARTATAAVSHTAYSEPGLDVSSLGPLDEIEPRDYLSAEVSKVDKALSAEFAKNESPSLFAHAVIWTVDLLAVALSCTPFIGLIELVDGNFTSPGTATASGVICLMVALFYFSITHALGGKTFGMMLTNTRIVDAYTFEPPSGQKALLRAVGSIISVAPALLGILLAVFNKKRRGAQDFISGTQVVRDF